MTKAELLEEIRTLLNEPQINLVQDPWNYDDNQLVTEIRSTIRKLKAFGVVTTVVMSTDGTLSPEPSDLVGLLIAYNVAYRLLEGDLTSKLVSGELGFMWKSGSDVYDTKTATIQFKAISAGYRKEFSNLMAAVVVGTSGSIDEAGSAFGNQVVPE